MKIEDMVMVINNQKGIEKNFLCSFESFVMSQMPVITSLRLPRLYRN